MATDEFEVLRRERPLSETEALLATDMARSLMLGLLVAPATREEASDSKELSSDDRVSLSRRGFVARVPFVRLSSAMCTDMII